MEVWRLCRPLCVNGRDASFDENFSTLHDGKHFFNWMNKVMATDCGWRADVWRKFFFFSPNSMKHYILQIKIELVNWFVLSVSEWRNSNIVHHTKESNFSLVWARTIAVSSTNFLFCIASIHQSAFDFIFHCHCQKHLTLTKTSDEVRSEKSKRKWKMSSSSHGPFRLLKKKRLKFRTFWSPRRRKKVSFILWLTTHPRKQ